MYAAYKGRIYTFLLRFLGDPELADDVTQETFTKAYRALGTLSNGHRVLPWLYRIASNAAIDQIRRRRRFGWLRLGAVKDTPEEPHVRDEHGRVPEREHIQAVLRSLPAENAMALLLHAVEVSSRPCDVASRPTLEPASVAHTQYESRCENAPDCSTSPDTSWPRARNTAPDGTMKNAMRSLPAENAMALLLHAVEGYSYTEIAEIQGCTMTAVRSRIARARASFKRVYGADGNGSGPEA